MTNTEIIVTGSTVAETVPQISGAALADDPGWVTAGLPRTYNTDSGQKMTAQIALTFSSVWQATSLISSAVAGLPLEVYRRDRTNDDRERVRLHPGWELLNLSPTGSPDISANAFRECLQAHALIRGNGYAEIIRNGSGRPVAMTILPPDMTWPDDSDGELTYWTAPSFREEARQIANVDTKPTSDGRLIRPTKSTPSARIDGVVAMLMAIALTLAPDEAPEPAIY